MSYTYPALDDKLIALIGRQKMFFVATAPLSEDAHVNLSPKGHDVFRILGPNRVAYDDLGGSGAETLEEWRASRLTRNAESIDGLPGLRPIRAAE